MKMKKIFLLLAATVFSMNCFSQNTAELRLNLPKDKIFTQNMDIKMKVKMGIQGMQIDYDFPFFAKISYKVIDIQNDNFILECVYEEVKINMDILGQKINYDSSDKTQDLSKNHFAKLFAAFIGKPFTMTFDKYQNVVSVEGFDKILTSILNSNGYTKEQQTQMTDLFQNVLGEEQIRKNFSAGNIVFPKNPVYQGFSWTSETSQSVQGINLQVKNVYKVEKIIDETIEISSVSSYQMDFSVDAEAQRFDAKLKKTEANGSYLLDLKTGWTISAKINSDMNLEISTNQGGTEFLLPMQIIMEIIVK
jgi:hypothetical protein